MSWALEAEEWARSFVRDQGFPERLVAQAPRRLWEIQRELKVGALGEHVTIRQTQPHLLAWARGQCTVDELLPTLSDRELLEAIYRKLYDAGEAK